ncbi:hypothetical protein M422DRAFT_32565 [Sphaerobolus stellatus SS14]|uniref:SWIM-type domain-containing protein n=1 Tax=Sphaerobolus stellatus (strain SS14) TaxID=990650 RepID=A0A0C9U972_SPHS4|nr:hypothetical protein M422DRAFT_32565 [Sphaerobolus stellatus SS14]
MVGSYTKEDINYEVKLEITPEVSGIIGCSCPAFAQSGLGCKHTFLTQRIAHFNIQLEKSILPPRLIVLQPTTTEVQLNKKRGLRDKARVLLDQCNSLSVRSGDVSTRGCWKINRHLKR